MRVCPNLVKEMADNGNSIPINSLTLKNAIQKVTSMLGEAAVESLMEDLEQQGINLNNPSSTYTLRQLESAIVETFGEDAATLLMERIKKELAY